MGNNLGSYYHFAFVPGNQDDTVVEAIDKRNFFNAQFISLKKKIK